MYHLLADTIDLKPPTGTTFAALGGYTIPVIIAALIRLVVVVAAIIFFFILVIGGIRWIASGGDKAQTEAARSQITSALVGLVIVFAAWAIVALINTFFNINIFNLALPVIGQ
jgi:TRAP-type C4-dicarboxylate transport system permease small subunit